jgi:hypothetical protein
MSHRMLRELASCKVGPLTGPVPSF